jgi:putative membrane protein
MTATPSPGARTTLAVGQPGAESASEQRGVADAWRRLGWAWPFWLASPALWLLVLIAIPVSTWTDGSGAFPQLATMGIMAHGFATLTSVASVWPISRLVTVGALIAAGAWVVEAVGTGTGYPFGAYHYAAVWQPQIGGVPGAVPLAWFAMLLPSWAVADAILGNRRSAVGTGSAGHPYRYQLMHAGLAGLVFTAWDLYLDPQMVSRGLWVWESPGDYFGVPWTNYAGWWVAAALLTLVAGYWRCDPGWRRVAIGQSSRECQPGQQMTDCQAARQRLMIVYTFTWALQALGLGLFWGQPGPALAGFAGMGVFVALGWLREIRAWT